MRSSVLAGSTLNSVFGRVSKTPGDARDCHVVHSGKLGDQVIENAEVLEFDFESCLSREMSAP
jgi:hypothetical protein